VYAHINVPHVRVYSYCIRVYVYEKDAWKQPLAVLTLEGRGVIHTCIECIYVYSKRICVRKGRVEAAPCCANSIHACMLVQCICTFVWARITTYIPKLYVYPTTKEKDAWKLPLAGVNMYMHTHMYVFAC
jgi:hypothetical protein